LDILDFCYFYIFVIFVIRVFVILVILVIPLIYFFSPQTNMGKAQRGRDKKRQNMTGLVPVAQMEAEQRANEPLVDEGPRVPLLTKVITNY
jgi:hypothetical protein